MSTTPHGPNLNFFSPFIVTGPNAYKIFLSNILDVYLNFPYVKAEYTAKSYLNPFFYTSRRTTRTASFIYTNKTLFHFLCARFVSSSSSGGLVCVGILMLYSRFWWWSDVLFRVFFLFFFEKYTLWSPNTLYILKEGGQTMGLWIEIISIRNVLLNRIAFIHKALEFQILLAIIIKIKKKRKWKVKTHGQTNNFSFS